MRFFFFRSSSSFLFFFLFESTSSTRTGTPFRSLERRRAHSSTAPQIYAMPQQTGRATGAKKGANTRKVQVPRGGLQPGSKYEKFAGTTPSLVPARAAADRTRTSKAVQPKGILKNSTANVNPSEQKQQEAGDEDPSALNESESRVSVSCVAAASQALSVSSPPVSRRVLIAFILQPTV